MNYLIIFWGFKDSRQGENGILNIGRIEKKYFRGSADEENLNFFERSLVDDHRSLLLFCQPLWLVLLFASPMFFNSSEVKI